jgi:hypothetical protein
MGGEERIRAERMGSSLVKEEERRERKREEKRPYIPSAFGPDGRWERRSTRCRHTFFEEQELHKMGGRKHLGLINE